MSNYRFQNTEDLTSIDATGFKARLKGLNIKDCIMVLEPNNECSLKLLTRSSNSSTFLEGVVRVTEKVIDRKRIRRISKTISTREMK